uniref:Acyl-CoA thioesterase n=1 Tax=Bosea sp. NBC_00436 TaxID=2969620 RepID=A0A9E7ZZ15_9HYPH
MSISAPQKTEGEEAPTRFVEMVFPEQANHYGTLFGGHALSLMGKAAFVAATRRARCAVVMATSEKCPSSDDLRLISDLRSGGSGSSGFEVMRPATGAASVFG